MIFKTFDDLFLAFNWNIFLECDGGDTCCTSSNKCGEGEGDCDADADCQSGLICGKDNCVGKNFDATDDCCMKPGNLTNLLHTYFIMNS